MKTMNEELTNEKPVNLIWQWVIEMICHTKNNFGA